MRHETNSIRAYALVLCLAAAAAAFPCAASISQSEGKVRLEPQHFFGRRGSEPLQQLAIQGRLEWASLSQRRPWQILLHGDFETFGRKDNSVDVDRAWWRTPLFEDEGPFVVLGRIHPSDVSGHPDAVRPWGLLAQSDAQNRSILLGSAFTNSAFPQPVLHGWAGAHFWSSRDEATPFKWGVSASPVFVPSLGSSVNYTAASSARAGRFGRQPPAFVEIENHRYAIDYRVDTSSIAKEVFQPQLQAHAYGRYRGRAMQWESWTVLRRSPSVRPTLETKGVLDLRGAEPRAIVYAKPRFLQEWSASFTQRFAPVAVLPGTVLFTSTEVRQDGSAGGEVGVNWRGFSASYLTERAALLAPTTYSLEDAPYARHLVQLEGSVPVARAVVYGGAKYHLLEKDMWMRAGVRTQVSEAVGVDVGVDMFAGRPGTYFGEWRGNDRLYFGLVWGLGI